MLWSRSTFYIINPSGRRAAKQNIADTILSLSVPLLKATVTSVLEYLISWFGEKKFTPELVIFNLF